MFSTADPSAMFAFLYILVVILMAIISLGAFVVLFKNAEKRSVASAALVVYSIIFFGISLVGLVSFYNF